MDLSCDSSRCTLCQLGGTLGSGITKMHMGAVDSPVVIVIPGPSKERYSRHPTTDLLSELIGMTGLAKHDPLIIPAVRCLHRRASNANIDTCADQYLKPIIQAHPRKMVIILGRTPMYALTGIGSGITKRYGLTEAVDIEMWSLDDPTPIIYGPDPEYIIFGQSSDSKDIDKLFLVLKKAAEIIDGEFNPAPAPTLFTLDGERAEMALRGAHKQSKHIAIDTETTSLRVSQCDLLGFSFATDESAGYWVPRENITQGVTDALNDLFEDPTQVWYMHNAKYDCLVLRKFFSPVRGIVHDTMVASQHDQENWSLSLKSQSIWRFGAKKWDDPIENVNNSKSKKKDFSAIPANVLASYAAEDAVWTYRLAKYFDVDSLIRNSFIYRNVLNVIQALTDAEMHGTTVSEENRQSLYLHSKEISEEMYKKLQGLAGIHVPDDYEESLAAYSSWKDTIIAEVGKDPTKGTKMAKWKQALRDNGLWMDPPEEPKWYNPNASGQTGQILFEHFGYPPMGKTDAGAYRTDKKVMAALEARVEHPANGKEFLAALQAYKRATKINQLMTQYVDLTDEDGRLRCSFKPTGTISGRLSNENPNLQQVPKILRPAFCAPEGYSLIELDFSQAEVRCGAALSGDPKMLKAIADADADKLRYEEEKAVWDAWRAANPDIDEDDFSYVEPPLAAIDVHRSIAALVEGIDPHDVTDEQRTHAKAITFGLMYGKTLKNLEDMFGPVRAKLLWDAFFGVFHVFGKWIEKIHASVKRTNEITTPFGRTRHLIASRLRNKSLRKYLDESLRQSVNFVVQSVASEITLRAIAAIWAELKKRSLDARIILTVHDSIIVECLDEQVPEAQNLCLEIMQRPTGSAILDKVSMRADCEVTRYWGKAINLEKLSKLIYGDSYIPQSGVSIDIEEDEEFSFEDEDYDLEAA